MDRDVGARYSARQFQRELSRIRRDEGVRAAQRFRQRVERQAREAQRAARQREERRQRDAERARMRRAIQDRLRREAAEADRLAEIARAPLRFDTTYSNYVLSRPNVQNATFLDAGPGMQVVKEVNITLENPIMEGAQGWELTLADNSYLTNCARAFTGMLQRQRKQRWLPYTRVMFQFDGYCELQNGQTFQISENLPEAVLLTQLGRLEQLFMDMVFSPCSPRDSESMRRFLTVILRFIISLPPGLQVGCLDGKHESVMRIGNLKVKSMPAVNNNCFFKSFREGCKITDYKFTISQCNEIRKRNGLPPNSKIPIQTALKVIEQFEKKVTIMYQGEDGMTSVGAPLEDSQCTLLFLDGHCYIFIGEYSRCKNCGKIYLHEHTCNPNKVQFFQNQICRNLCANPKGMRTEDLLDKSVMHYDIETHRDNQYLKHEPYIVGCAYYNLTGDVVYLTFEGANCMEEFYDFLKSDDVAHCQYLNAYNGSRFDHYYLMSIDVERTETLEKFILSSGRLLKATICGKKLIDLNQHIVGSLKNNLLENNCSVAKGDINHDESVAWEETTEGRKIEVRSYLKCDVLGLMELYEKINEVMYDGFQVNICNFVTSSSMCFRLWVDKFLGDVRIKLPDLELYNVSRSAVYGGRCYPTKRGFVSDQLESVLLGESTYEDVTDYLFDADIVSMYPHVMESSQYPVGSYYRWDRDWKSVKENWTLKASGRPVPYKEVCGQKVPDCLGIYLIEYVPPRDLITQPILPKKTPKGLMWDLQPGQGYYTSVDIMNAVRHGYNVTFLSGYYWMESARVFSNYVNHFYEAKRKAKKGTAAYTSAKINLNALYGKQLQREVVEKQHLLGTGEEFWKVLETDLISGLRQVKSKWLVQSKPIHQESIRPSKPTFLGAFILSYSRVLATGYYDKLCPPLMTVEDKILAMPFYMDTDSMVVRSDYVHLLGISKDLGGIDNDVNGKILEAYFVAPKLYGFKYLTPDNQIKFHLRGKGIDNDKLAFEDMRGMALEGKSFEYFRDFSIKKHHLGRQVPPEGFEIFTLQHVLSEDTGRTLNETMWSGRQWTAIGVSMPHGFDFDSLVSKKK